MPETGSEWAMRKNKIDLTNIAIAGFVFLFTQVVYIKTVAPTFSFWDCGEFIACAYIQGIAHPPGTPLYLLLGRIFSLLPLASDIALRINLLSAFSSAVAAVFAYLVLVRLVRLWHGENDGLYNRVIAYIGGITGALFAAFATTNWANAIEAEVYAPAMAIMLAIFWLALKTFDSDAERHTARIALLAFYLGLLGIGIHLTLYIIIPIVALFFIIKRESGWWPWVWVSLLIILELYLVFLTSSRPDEIPFYIPVVVVFTAFLFHFLQLKKVGIRHGVTLGLFLLALYPFYLVVINSVMMANKKSGAGETIKGLASLPFGWIGVLGLALWGGYWIYRYFSTRKSGTPEYSDLVLGIYGVAPVLLIILGIIFRGYVAFLGISAVAVALTGVVLWRNIHWSLLVAIGSISLIVLGFWQFVIGMAAGLVIIFLLGIFTRDRYWKTALAVIFLGLVGFSVHTYIPVRSALNPAIDENDPDQSLSALVGYLERKQYGSESMTSRMFVRRGEWQNQFGDYRRMGFWRFFKDQYGFRGAAFAIPLVLGLFGIWELMRRKSGLGLAFLALLLISTVGLVLYMNFADGTRQSPLTGQDYIEVRNRDYFFTPGFILFGMAIGLGIAGLLDLIRDTIKDKSSGWQKSVFTPACLLVLLPLVPLKINYHENDRSRNFMPYDYAYNLLSGCEKDAILITNGDNDTFPLWCIQEVYGVRKDVRVVNLSLANMDWYVKQMKNFRGVPMTWSDQQISDLRPFRTPDGKSFRIQDQVLDEIIAANRWQYPIHMTVNTPEENRRFRGNSLSEYLALEGMVFTLVKTRGLDQVNYEKTRRQYWEEYLYRGLADSTIYKDEATVRLVGNYAQGFMWLADTLRRAGDNEGALVHIYKGLEILPNNYDLLGYAVQLMGDMGRYDSMQVILRSLPEDRQSEILMHWGMVAGARKDYEKAIMAFKRVLEIYPEYVEGFQALAGTYYRMGDYFTLKKLATDWVARHPEDNDTRRLLIELDKIAPLVDSVMGADQ